MFLTEAWVISTVGSTSVTAKLSYSRQNFIILSATHFDHGKTFFLATKLFYHRKTFFPWQNFFPQQNVLSWGKTFLPEQNLFMYDKTLFLGKHFKAGQNFSCLNPSCTKGGGRGVGMTLQRFFKHNCAKDEPKPAKFLLIHV